MGGLVEVLLVVNGINSMWMGGLNFDGGAMADT